MNPAIEAACLRLQAAAAMADERDRCTVKGTDVRMILRELATLQETFSIVELVPDLPRD